MYNDAWTLKISYFCSNEKKKKKNPPNIPKNLNNVKVTDTMIVDNSAS